MSIPIKYSFLLLLLFLLKTVFSNAQKTIDLSFVDLVSYDSGNFTMFEKKGENNYSIVSLRLKRDSKTRLVDVTIERDRFLDKLENIINEDEFFFYKKDLKKIDKEDFVSSPFRVLESHDSWFKMNKQNTTFVINLLTKSIASVKQFYKGKANEYASGFYSYANYPDDDIKRWRVYNPNYRDYYKILDLDFGEGKHIFLLIEESYTNIEFIIIPTKKAIYSFSSDFSMSKIKKAKNLELNLRETFKKADVEDFYILKENKEGRYNLMSQFSEKIIKKAYDTIIFNTSFIIAKRKNKIDIFNSYEQKVELKDIKSAYPYQTGFEVISRSGARYYDSNLKVIDTFPKVYNFFCGTGRYYGPYYDIKYDTVIKSQKLIERYQNSAKECILGGTLKEDKISFLKNDENINKYGRHIGQIFIKVKRKNKYGIYGYNHTKCKETFYYPDFSSSKTKEEDILHKSIEPEVLLSLDKDSIHHNKNDGLIYFYNKNKIGVLSINKKVQYDTFLQKTHSFYEFTKNGKKGWLDITTKKEFYEK